MESRGNRNRNNAAEPKHARELTGPQHLEEGQRFRAAWRKQPRAWKRKIVGGVAAAALAVCVPLAALGTGVGSDASQPLPASDVLQDVETTIGQVAAESQQSTQPGETPGAPDGQAPIPGVDDGATAPDGAGLNDTDREADGEGTVVLPQNKGEDQGEGTDSAKDEPAITLQAEEQTSIDINIHLLQTANGKVLDNDGKAYTFASDGSNMGQPATTSRSQVDYTVTLNAQNANSLSFDLPANETADGWFSVLGMEVSGFLTFRDDAGTAGEYGSSNGVRDSGYAADSDNPVYRSLSLAVPEETDFEAALRILNNGYEDDEGETVEVSEDDVLTMLQLRKDYYLYASYVPAAYNVKLMAGEGSTTYVATADELQWSNVNGNTKAQILSNLNYHQDWEDHKAVYEAATWKTARHGGSTLDLSTETRYYELAKGENVKTINLYPYTNVTFNAGAHGTGADVKEEHAIDGDNGARVRVETPATCPFTPASGYRFVGWSVTQDATYDDVQAGGQGGETSATSVEPGGTLYLESSTTPIYAIYKQSNAEITLDYGSTTPDSGANAPAKAPADENLQDGSTVVSYSTTVPGLSDAIMSADGKQVLVGWTTESGKTTQQVVDENLTIYQDACTIPAAALKDMTLHAVWDDSIAFTYQLSTDAETAGKGTVVVGDSETALTEQVGRLTGGQAAVKGAKLLANMGSQAAVRYWKVADTDAAKLNDVSAVLGDTITPQLSNLKDGTTAVTYVAYLRPATKQITLDPNEGTSNGTTNSFVITATAEPGTDTYKATFPTATRDGYAFNGWVDNQPTPATHQAGEATFDTDSVPTQAKADWSSENEPHTVTFVYNDGTTADQTQSSAAGPVTVTLPTPTRAGYTFLGWSDTQYANATDGDGVVRDKTAAWLTEGDKTSNFSRTYPADKTLYALWDKNVTVKFQANYGAGNVGQGTVQAVAPSAGSTQLSGTTGQLSATIGRVYGDYEAVTAKAVANTGNAFLGWTVNAPVAQDADVPAEAKARVAQKAPALDDLLAAGPSNTVTYYANFGISVTLAPEGGTVYENGAGSTANVVKFLYSNASAALPAQGTSNGQISNSGKALVGWHADSGISDNAGLAKIKTGETVLTSPGALAPAPTTNVEYHAVWDTPIVITFSLGSNPNAKFENSIATTVTLRGNQMTSAKLQRTVGANVDESDSSLRAMGWTDATEGKTYTFDYWDLAGTKTDLANPATIEYNGATGWGPTRTYTAVYKSATTVYEVELDYNGGKDPAGNGAPMDGNAKVSAGDDLALPSDMTKDGCFFLGWTTDGALIGQGTEYNSPLLPGNKLQNVQSDMKVHAVYDTAATIQFNVAPAGAGWGDVSLAVDPAQAAFASVDNTNNVATLAMHRAGKGAITATPTPKAPQADATTGKAGYLFDEWTGDKDASDSVAAATNAITVNATGGSPYDDYTNHTRTYTANFQYRNVLNFHGGHDASNDAYKMLDPLNSTTAQNVAFNSVDLAKLTHDASPDDKVAVGWGESESATPTTMIADPGRITTTAPTTYYVVWDDTVTLTYQIGVADTGKGKLKAPSGATGMVTDTADVKYHEKVAAHATGADAPKGITVEAATDQGWQFDKFVDENGNEVQASQATVTVNTTTLGGTTINTGATLVPVKQGSTDTAYQTHTFTAQFKKVSYQVEYVKDASGTATFTEGTGGKTTFADVKLGDALPAFADPSTGAATPSHKDGNEFLGWSVDGSTVTAITTIDATAISQMTAGKLTLKPVFRPYKYQVQFVGTALSPDVHGGLAWADNVLDFSAGTAWTGNNGPLTNPTACDENGAVLPSDEAALYDFVGWYRTDDLADSGKLAGKDQPLTMQAIATQGGVADETMGTATPVKLYAKFAPKDVTITFEGNGGNWTDTENGDAEKAQYALDKPYKSDYTLEQRVADLFKMPGHHVKGWNKSKDSADLGTVQYGTTDPYTVGKSDNTLYAVWEANDYTITFDGNGATSGQMDPQTLTYRENDDQATDKLNENKFQKDGFSFAGWRIQGANNGQLYADQEPVRNLTDGLSVTLVAQWDRTATITYDLNSPDWTADDVPAPFATDEVEAGKSDSKFTPPTVDPAKVKRAGWELLLDSGGKTQWNAEADGTGTTYAAGDECNAGNITTDTTLYLMWKKAKSPFQIVPKLQTINPADGTGTGYESAPMTYDEASAAGYVMQATTNAKVKWEDVKNDADFPSSLVPPAGYQISTTKMPGTASVKVTPATLDSDGNVADCTKFDVYCDRVSYEVKYSYTDAPSGLTAPAAKQYAWGQTVQLAPLPGKPAGKTYPAEGWVVKTASGDDVTVENGAFTMPQEAVNITLDWSAVQVRVKLMSDPGDANWPSKWEGDVFTVDYGTPLNDARMNTVVKTGIKQNYGITGWLQYKMTDQGGKGDLVANVLVDPRSVLLNQDTVFVAQTGPCFNVTYTAGDQGTFANIVFSGANVNGTALLTDFHGDSATNAKVAQGDPRLTHKPGYKFNGWEFTPAKDSSSNNLTAGTKYTSPADGSQLPTYVDQDYEFKAVWVADDSDLRLKLTSTVNGATVTWAADSTVNSSYTNNTTYLGKTAKTGEPVQLPTAAQVTADDYTLTGWKNLTTNEESAQGSSIAMPGSKTSGGNDYTEFEPVAQEKEVTFTYAAEDATMGTVTTDANTVKKLAGTAAMSSAAPKSMGYRFDKWQVKSGSSWTDLPNDGTYQLADYVTGGITVKDGSITPQKTSIGGVDKYTAAAYRAVFAPRSMPVEVQAAAHSSVSGAFSDNSQATHGVDYGETIAAYLTAKSMTAFGSSFTPAADAGYQLAAQQWKVSVYPLQGISADDQPVYATAPTVTLTNDPASVEAIGRVVIEPNVTASQATVLFDKNDGTAGGASLSGTTDAGFTALTAAQAKAQGFAKTGHHIDFWAKGAANSVDKDAQAYALGGTGTYPAGTTTVYAHWVPNTVTYVPSLNGGTDATAPEKFSGTYGGTADSPAEPSGLKPPTADKEFAGWSKKADGSGTLYTAGAAGVISVDDDTEDDAEVPLYAVWKDATYTLTYNANGGQNPNAMTDKARTTTWASGNTSFAAEQNAFTRTNFDFVGWNTQADGKGATYQPDDLVQLSINQKNTVLYAQWKSNLQTYNVYFCDADGNRVTDGASALAPQVNVLGTDAVAIPGGSAPQAGTTKENGLVFAGWAATDQLNDAGTAPAKGNWVTGATTVATAVGYTQDPNATEVELKQVWRIAWDDGYTIRYHSNAPAKQVLGGQTTDLEPVTVNPASAGDPYDQQVKNLDTTSTTLDASKFEIAGYTQTGWATTADGARAYADKQTLSNPNHLVPLGGKQTEADLFATWQAASGFTARFLVNGVVVDSAAATWDKPFAQTADLSSVIPAGKALKGWYTAANPAQGAKVAVGTDTFGAVVNAAGFSDAPTNTKADLHAKLVDLQVQLVVDTNPGSDKAHPATVDGKKPGSDDTVTVDDKQQWTGGLTLPAADRPGYDLAGWTTEDGTPVSDGDDFKDLLGGNPASADDGTVQLKLKPVWQQKQAVITYQVNDPTMGEVSLNAATSWKASDAEQVPAATGSPVGAKTQGKPGYRFVNWTVNYTGAIAPALGAQSADDALTAQADGAIGGTQVYSTNDSILPGRDSDGVYPQGAVYTANYVQNGNGRTTFESNGGTGTVNPVDQTIGKDITLPSDDPLSRDHYTFGGWELPDGTTAQPGDAYTVKGDDTVKAVWVPKQYKVTVPSYDDPKYGTVDGNEGSLPYGGGVPDDFVNVKPADGKVLTGWRVVVTDENGKVIRDEVVTGKLSDIVVEGDTVLTPVWGDAPADQPNKPAAVRPALPTTGDPLADAMIAIGTVAALAAGLLVALGALRKRGRHEER